MKWTDEFAPVSRDEWRAVVEKDLKGADFDKKLVSLTLDGLRLEPMTMAEDVPYELPRLAMPNTFAFREEVRSGTPEEANLQIRSALERGADEIAILLYPQGVQVDTLRDFQTLLKGVDLHKVPIHWVCGPLAPAVLGFLKQLPETHDLHGSVDLDPALDVAAGWSTDTDWKGALVQCLNEINAFPSFGALSIRGSFLEKSGASLAQEVAWSMALLADYLVVLGENGYDLETLVAKSEIRVGVGTNYFLEISKLRALRWCVGSMLDSFGITARPKIHAITTSSNKTLYDPTNNLLRATVEAAASVLGGANSLTVAAYDQGYHAPDEFSHHLARNTRALLLDEAHLGKVEDPLAGSYAVEKLTHDLAQIAWNAFRQIETYGGFMAAWEEGWIAEELGRVRAERAKQVSSRRRGIVGTTLYPNQAERRLADVQAKSPARRVKPVIEVGHALSEHLSEEQVPSTPLDPFRPSWPYEHLRLRTERSGKTPQVLLALVGDVKMRNARAGFALGLFGAAGYAVRQEVFESPDGIPLTGLDLIVLCSADTEYAEIAAKLLARKPECPVYLAGNPSPPVDGIAGTVHLRQDLLETLNHFHDLFGIPPMPIEQPKELQTR